MLAFYAQVKAVHVLAVILSGTLFLTRGLMVQAGAARWAMAAPLRYASYGVDTVLLTAALMLATMLPAVIFANHWLALKITLLFVYVALGSLALKRAQGPRARTLAFVAALAVYVTMIGVGRAHHPLGWIALLRG